MKSLLCVVLLLVTTSASLQAQVPAPPLRISYQGYLVDANNVPLGDTTPKNFDAVFRIYNVSSGGVSLWTEQQTITVDKGYFSVLLGEGGPVGSELRNTLDTVFNTGTSDRFIGVTVKGLPTAAGIEIAPRIQFLTSPYAIVAAHAKVSDQARAVVNSSGNSVLAVTTTSGASRVGINTPNPAFPLDVAGDIQSSGTVRATTFEGRLNAANLTGTIPTANLPAGIVTTDANGVLRAARFLGQGTVPVGGIILWSGIDRSLSSSGWALCNGQPVTLELEDATTLATTTPDLRDRFVMGSSGLYATNVTTVSGPRDIRQSGGTDFVSLTAANLPAHNHELKDYYWLAQGSYFQGESSPTDRLAGHYERIPAGNGAGPFRNEGGNASVASDSAAYLTHTTTSTGSGAAVNITPKYYKLAYIMRWK